VVEAEAHKQYDRKINFVKQCRIKRSRHGAGFELHTFRRIDLLREEIAGSLPTTALAHCYLTIKNFTHLAPYFSVILISCQINTQLCGSRTLRWVIF
jgi:hypothetical protein